MNRIVPGEWLAPALTVSPSSRYQRPIQLELHALDHSSPAFLRGIGKDTAQQAEVLRIVIAFTCTSSLVLGLVAFESGLALFLHLHVVDQTAAFDCVVDGRVVGSTVV